MRYSECPNCEGSVKINGSPHVGQGVVCNFCSTKLTIVWLDPIELDWNFDESYNDGYDSEEEELAYEDGYDED